MTLMTSKTAVVVGGGPAGLMAAETLSAAGLAVTVMEQMPSLGRKFLMAGRGGLNLTHSEDAATFLARYGGRAGALAPALAAFTPADLTAWAHGLGQPTFVGSSGRVFPTAMKASPLLRAWLARLQGQGVTLRPRTTWRGWDAAGALVVETAQGGREAVNPDITVLALGGASWARLGADGAWAPILQQAGAPLRPFRTANCGFTAEWSERFRASFAGSPVKGIALTLDGQTRRGDAVVTQAGLEGGVVYALAAPLRDAIERDGSVRVLVDLKPDVATTALAARLAKARPGESLSNRLRKGLHLAPAAAGLLREAFGAALSADPATLAAQVKAAPLILTGAAAMDRAISTAGGVDFSAVDDRFMLRARPGVFIAGEMLDWEAPTGGYLLQACFATGRAAAFGGLRYLGARADL